MVDNTPYWKLHDKHDESLWEDVQKKVMRVMVTPLPPPLERLVGTC